MDTNSSILFESESVSPIVDFQSRSAPLQRKYPCRHCTKVLTSSSNRLRHERQIHPQLIGNRTANITLNCIFCGKSCLGQRSLQLHAQSCRGASTPSLSTNSNAANTAVANLESTAQSSSLFAPRSDNNNNNIINNNNNNSEQSFLTNSIPLISQSKKRRSNELRNPAISINDSSASDSPSNSSSDSDFNSDSESNTRRGLNAALSQTALLTEEQLNNITNGFLHWLQQGPLRRNLLLLFGGFSQSH